MPQMISALISGCIYEDGPNLAESFQAKGHEVHGLTLLATLVTTAAAMTCFPGRTVWDACHPNVPLRQCLNLRRPELESRFGAEASYEIGLRRTIDRYVIRSLFGESR
jgi:hypothetical protein